MQVALLCIYKLRLQVAFMCGLPSTASATSRAQAAAELGQAWQRSPQRAWIPPAARAALEMVGASVSAHSVARAERAALASPPWRCSAATAASRPPQAAALPT